MKYRYDMRCETIDDLRDAIALVCSDSEANYAKVRITFPDGSSDVRSRAGWLSLLDKCEAGNAKCDFFN